MNSADVFRSPLDREGLDFTGDKEGNPVNAWALVLLILLSIVSFALNFRKMSYGLAAVWIVLLGLALLRMVRSRFSRLSPRLYCGKSGSVCPAGFSSHIPPDRSLGSCSLGTAAGS